MKKAILDQIRASEAEYQEVYHSTELGEWAKAQRIHELTTILLHLRQTMVDLVEAEMQAELEIVDRPKLKLVA